MTFNPAIHHRRSLRLKGYDYSLAGAYFVTICTKDRACVFGEVVEGEMRLNEAGRMVEQCWQSIPEHFALVELDAFVVMPNHIHGIVVLVGAGLVPARDVPDRDRTPKTGAPTMEAPTMRAPTRGAPTTLGAVVGAFKSRVTVEYIRSVKNGILPPFKQRLWQRNYYEHIIRNEDALARIREYIVSNPLMWALDRENLVDAEVVHRAFPHQNSPAPQENM